MACGSAHGRLALGVHGNGQRATRQVDRDRNIGVHEPQTHGDRDRCAGAGSAGERQADAALPYRELDAAGRAVREFDIGAARERGRLLDARAESLDVAAGELAKEHCMGIPGVGQFDRNGTIDVDRRRAEGADESHVDRDERLSRGELDITRADAGVGLDARGARAESCAASDVKRHTAQAIAAHLWHAPVGVEDPHAGGAAVDRWGKDEQDSVGANAEVAIAQADGLFGGEGGFARSVDNDEVVAEPLVLRKCKGGHRGIDECSVRAGVRVTSPPTRSGCARPRRRCL